MVLSAILLAAAMVTPSPAESPAEPPPPPPAPNAELWKGLIVSAERLLPIVAVHDAESNQSLATNLQPPPRDQVSFGFPSANARSIVDLPGVAFDGAFSGVTVGTSILFGNVKGKVVDASGASRKEDAITVAIAPRLGYAARLGRAFALWPRVGLLLAAPSGSNDDAVPAATAQLGFVWFPVRHVGLTLTPSGYLPTKHDAPWRASLDAGLLLAF